MLYGIPLGKWRIRIISSGSGNKMKIGIITFHWAANYGAVLQGYALQEKLTKKGNKVSIINYYPKRFKKNYLNALLTKHIRQIPARIREIEKEKNIAPFRKRYLNMTKYYSSSEKLKNAEFLFDAYICGSDQIWNESFTLKGERKKTFSYFLDFAPKEKIIASYAASFGVTKYNQTLKPYIKKELKRFDFISVREKSGAEIVEDLGLEKPYIVPDPTLLLEKKDYEKFVTKNMSDAYIYKYMLHGQKCDVYSIIEDNNLKVVEAQNESVEEWLSNIYYSELVITNSFHGVVFSIMFQRPFIAVLIEGSGMNDRIVTLLKKSGLENRIWRKGTTIESEPIDWQTVSKNMEEYRLFGEQYLDMIINYKK